MVQEKARMAWILVKRTVKEWKDDDGLQWGAALAYYAVFSLAPVLLIAIALAGVFLDEDDVRENVLDEVEALLGPEVAAFVGLMVERAADTAGNTFTVVTGIVVLLVGATGAFAQLNVALNRMWGIRAEPKKGWLRLIKKRVLAFGFVVVVGFLLLVSLVVSALITGAGAVLQGHAPGVRFLIIIASHLAAIGVSTILFALIFQYLPDAVIRWRDVSLGAFVTAVLFELGKLTFSLYLGATDVASRFGAAGALVLILVWVWFASQILFFGAEFTQVWSRRHGERIRPEPHAVRVGD